MVTANTKTAATCSYCPDGERIALLRDAFPDSSFFGALDAELGEKQCEFTKTGNCRAAAFALDSVVTLLANGQDLSGGGNV